jgi:hypothetical protein
MALPRHPNICHHPYADAIAFSKNAPAAAERVGWIRTSAADKRAMAGTIAFMSTSPMFSSAWARSARYLLRPVKMLYATYSEDRRWKKG